MNGSFTTVIVALLTLYVSDELDYSDLSEASWLLATLTLYCVSLVISVWSIVGIWRSATSYQLTGGALKWSITARLLALLGTLGFASEVSRATLPVFQTLIVRAGIETLGPPLRIASWQPSIRHTYVTNELELGQVTIHDIASNCGTSITFIERHYSHAKVHSKAQELAEKAFGNMDVSEDMAALFN